MVEIYYGMCGCFKYTTLMAEAKRGDELVLSRNKPFMEYSEKFLGRLPGDLDLAVYRLLQLKEAGLYHDTTYRVERGITDFLESWTSRPEGIEKRGDQGFIYPWVIEESQLLTGHRIRRTLLVMRDTEFIQGTILREPSRLRRYPSLEEYLNRQEQYIEFTKRWNVIDRVIEIPDALAYVKELE